MFQGSSKLMRLTYLLLGHRREVIECMDKVQKIFDFACQGLSFNNVCKNIKPIKVENDKLICQFEVEPELSNSAKTLHGGYISHAVDFITSMDLVRHGFLSHVSVNLNVSYMKPGMLGSLVRTESTVLRKGKKLAFMDIKFYDDKKNTLLASGCHTKFILDF
ncbi:hypothetical protein Ciccas_006782 [Cichlidogyrus casuarinus]|uniref:Thioesterase domain-containing protein n=1 Tax=Cichlidogyrus casuarinus TaxID=1844966 RepID=A0ABD2Q4R5_9PLAT